MYARHYIPPELIPIYTNCQQANNKIRDEKIEKEMELEKTRVRSQNLYNLFQSHCKHHRKAWSNQVFDILRHQNGSKAQRQNISICGQTNHYEPKKIRKTEIIRSNRHKLPSKRNDRANYVSGSVTKQDKNLKTTNTITLFLSIYKYI